MTRLVPSPVLVWEETSAHVSIREIVWSGFDCYRYLPDTLNQFNNDRLVHKASRLIWRLNLKIKNGVEKKRKRLLNRPPSSLAGNGREYLTYISLLPASDRVYVAVGPNPKNESEKMIKRDSLQGRSTHRSSESLTPSYGTASPRRCHLRTRHRRCSHRRCYRSTPPYSRRIRFHRPCISSPSTCYRS